MMKQVQSVLFIRNPHTLKKNQSHIYTTKLHRGQSEGQRPNTGELCDTEKMKLSEKNIVAVCECGNTFKKISKAFPCSHSIIQEVRLSEEDNQHNFQHAQVWPSKQELPESRLESPKNVTSISRTRLHRFLKDTF